MKIFFAILMLLFSLNKSFAQYPVSNGNINTSDYITYVHIDGLSNYSSAESGGYGDYTNDVSALLARGQSYELDVSVEFDENIPYVYISAWIDWNQDEDFTDPGEEYIVATNVNTQGPHSINVLVPNGALLGATRMRVSYRWDSQPSSSGTFPFGEVEDYNVIITTNGVLSYNSTNVYQETGYALVGDTDQKILKIVVSTTGNSGTLNADSFTLNTGGCTAPTNDISKARLYYTGTNNSFSTDNQFGSDIDDPNGSFSISGSQSLYPENNFFWLVYDIKSSATLNNKIDAQCTQVRVGSTNYTPNNSSPSGDKTIMGSPIVTTGNPANVTSYSCDASGEVTNNGGSAIIERGICYSTNPNPTIIDNKLALSSGTGTFSGTLEYLQYNTTYYVRAYATNSGFTGYGQERAFTTVNDPHYWIKQDIATGSSYIDLLTSTFSGQSFTSLYSGLISDIQIYIDGSFSNATLRLFYGEQDGTGYPFYSQTGISTTTSGERWHNIHLDNRFFMFANSKHTFDINTIKWLSQSGNPYPDGKFRNLATWDSDRDWCFRIRVEYPSEVVYVNSAWSGRSEGENLGKGRIFGKNAFDNIIDGLDEVAINGRVVILSESTTTIADLDLTYKNLIIRLEGGDLEVTNSFTVTDQYIVTPKLGRLIQSWTSGEPPLFFPVRCADQYVADLTVTPDAPGKVYIRSMKAREFNSKSDCGFDYEADPSIGKSTISFTYSADRDLDITQTNFMYDIGRTLGREWKLYIADPPTTYDTDKNLFTSTFDVRLTSFYAPFGQNTAVPLPGWALVLFGSMLLLTGYYFIQKS
jgi:hypothetical protein